MTKTKSNPTNHTMSLTSALDFIANTLYETELKDHDDYGKDKENILDFPQNRILNGIAYAIASTIHITEETFDRAKQKVRQRIREHRNDEISELNQRRANQWADQLEFQLAVLSDMLDVACEVYTRHTGQKFMFVPKTQVRKEFQTPALLYATKYADPAETILGGGVDADETKAA